MKWFYPALGLGALLLILAPVGLRVLSWPGEQSAEVASADVRAGEVLFAHEWQAHDKLCASGDGLGPVFNATSCAACHKQGGLGGGGGLEHNVTTFEFRRDRPVVVMDPDDQVVRNLAVRDGVIHAFAIAPEYQETLHLLGGNLPRTSRPDLGQLIGPQEKNRALGRAQRLELPAGLRLSQRNTPALFGVGLIDAIPERAILANARKQQLRYGMAPGDTDRLPVGRPSRTKDGRIGKFGWKGQSASLQEFVQAACANELGLSNPGHAQPKPLGKPDYQAVGFDLTQKQCDQMTAFVAALPRPEQRLPDDPDHRAAVVEGQQLFNKIGCAACHTPQLGSAEGIYSDLLLHRMGEELEAGGSSYGGDVPPPGRSPGDDGPLPSEWRTPPLWGVADSAPYLHDGRAATLEQAIRMHGGQAQRSAARFERLSPTRQNQVLLFLKSLRAPSGK